MLKHRNIKVLFTLDTLRGGGTETSTLELINRLSEETVTTVCYFYATHDLRDAYERSRCKLVYLELSGKYTFLEGIKRLKRLIQKEQFDLIVSSLYRASIMSRVVSLVTGVPLIDTMVNESYGKWKRREYRGIHVVKLLFVFLLDRATAFIPRLWISNSAFIAQRLGRQLGIPDKKIKVLYRGRQCDNIEPWTVPHPLDDFHFISVGRLFPQKGHAHLITAFSYLHCHDPNTRLTIYGEGPERQRLELLIRTMQLNDLVQLPGHVASGWMKLYEAHCFVLPSLYEGFSGALVEALMIGIPVIASDIPVNKEAVVNYKTGLLHKVNDADDLLAKMKEVITHYEEAVKRARAARQEAKAKYDIRKIVAEYEDVLRRCVRTNTRLKNEDSPAYTEKATSGR